MSTHTTNESGFSLMETIFALGILTVGTLGMAGVLSQGMQHLSTSPADVVVTQKAAEGIEAVFSARDSRKLTWAQIRNVRGTGSDGGVFLDGPTDLTLAGADGLVNTADDPAAIESNDLPGADGILGTDDDRTVPLDGFTREIKIRDVAGSGGNLRSIEVTITYQGAGQVRTYVLTSYISVYA